MKHADLIDRLGETARRTYETGRVPDGAAPLMVEAADALRATAGDEAVERAARALYELRPGPWTWEEILDGWRNKPYPDYPHTVDDLKAQARAALEAALGIEGDE